MNVRVDNLKHTSVKKIIKRGLQHIAAAFGQHNRASKEPQLLILMYHRILPQNDKRAQLEEPGMMVTPETFRMHMHLIKQRFDVLSLSQWITCKHNGETLPTRCCAITFDDGWADNYEFAYPILQELNLPATIFLVSDMVGSNQLFWPERLAQVLSEIAHHCPEKWAHPCLKWIKYEAVSYDYASAPPDQEQLSELIQQVKNLRDDEIHAHIDLIEDELKLNTRADPSILNWQQIAEMSQSGLIEAGSHTCRHIRLNDGQNEELLKQEIIQSKLQIQKQLGQSVEAFCYPNGDYSPRAVELVKQNYQCAVTTSKGWNTINTDEHLLHRIGIHEDISADKTAFLARLSGWV
ncbi:MAG: polysaccharide deacetylase family protein [Gammaproteobacteria bacterium]|nr:polysaccharide deacetylase family protein [Gammaproteobacteria bacterium]